MAIGTATQRGDYVYAYNERGNFSFSINGELHGFTSGSVSVRRGNYVYMYDERGRFIRSLPC